MSSDTRALDSSDAPQFALAIRRIILEQSRRANVGHIGSSLSIADIMAALFCGPLRCCEAQTTPERNRFILSKGHAALALYAALHLGGVVTAGELDSFCGDGSFLGVHPELGLAGIDFASGSLGHGLSVGTGAALGARMQQSQRRVFVVLSDAECNEGSVWEAAAFAGHHQLSNLTAIVDVNGQQAFGYTKDVLDQTSLAARWMAFGWDAVEVPGHDLEALTASLTPAGDRPRVVLAQTTFGKGVPFMHNQIRWHYSPMSEADYVAALASIDDTSIDDAASEPAS
jgi:transketolase